MIDHPWLGGQRCFRGERPAAARLFLTSTLVVATVTSTAASVIIYFVLAILAGISSALSKVVSAISGSTPQPDPRPPYGLQGLLLILSPWLVFAAVAALRWIGCAWRTTGSSSSPLPSGDA